MKKVIAGKLKTVYRGVIFDIKQQLVTFPNGDVKNYEYAYRDDSVLILPFNEKGELMMIREYRKGNNKVTWFLPAGRMDKKGEEPKSAAQRELREELGFRAKNIKLFAKRFPSGHSVYNVYIYVAKDLVIDPLIGDESMPIRVIPVAFKKAVTMALNGTIENEFIAFNIIRFDYLRRIGKFKW
ncbi:MAG: NUDIX hydrolase [Candidatus Magasanikbacteria bacterium]|jgi:ADP-ribose pyrophosphatase